MNYTQFIAEYAERVGVSIPDAKFLVEEFCEEILRQLVLDQEVRIARLGVFSSKRTKTTKRVSGLPNMQGKPANARSKKRLKFRAFNNARQALNRDFSVMVSGNLVPLGCNGQLVKSGKGVSMAKKKGEHVNIDLPEGVKQITINVASDEKKKKRKSGESASSKRRLLG